MAVLKNNYEYNEHNTFSSYNLQEKFEARSITNKHRLSLEKSKDTDYRIYLNEDDWNAYVNSMSTIKNIHKIKVQELSKKVRFKLEI